MSEKTDDMKKFMVDQLQCAKKKDPEKEKERLQECMDKKVKVLEKFVIKLVEDTTFAIPSEA